MASGATDRPVLARAPAEVAAGVLPDGVVDPGMLIVTGNVTTNPE
jgi:hypothetical protein